MYGGVEMKKICLTLSAVLFSMCSFYSSVHADETFYSNEMIFVDSETAEDIIKKYFGNIATRYASDYIIEPSDAEILNNVLGAYNTMLSQSGGFVTVKGAYYVCLTGFADLEPRMDKGITYAQYMDLFSAECIKFVRNLVTATPKPSENCPYAVTKVDGKQSHIRYIRKEDGSYFDRKCNNYIPWRFFNPGNLRDSSNDYKCAVLDTSPNGKFAVFPDEETGWAALKRLLKLESRICTRDGCFKYPDLTARQAIVRYAPFVENNVDGYIDTLINAGVDVDTKILRDYTDEELEQLMHAIGRAEGWYSGIKHCEK